MSRKTKRKSNAGKNQSKVPSSEGNVKELSIDSSEETTVVTGDIDTESTNNNRETGSADTGRVEPDPEEVVEEETTIPEEDNDPVEDTQQESEVESAPETVSEEDKDPLIEAMEGYIADTKNNADIAAIAQRQQQLWSLYREVVTNEDYNTFQQGWKKMLSIVSDNLDDAFEDPKPFRGTQRPHWKLDLAAAGAFNVLTFLLINTADPKMREIVLSRLDVERSFKGTDLQNNATVIRNLNTFYKL